MQLQNTEVKPKSLYFYILFAGIILVSFNLRPAITSVGPLVGMIQNDIGLAHWGMGILTSLPLVCFAIMSPLVPRIAIRFTNERTLLFGLTILLTGILIRSIMVTFFLFAGTFLIGIGIAICNVLLPVIIKDKFPTKFGLMTSVYSTSMGLLAAFASGVSVPLAVGLDLGWQRSLIVWALPAVIGITLWIYLVRGANKGTQPPVTNNQSKANRMWKSALAWQVALYMGFQSFLFYVTITWLPEILHTQGLSMASAGWFLSFSQFMGLPASFLVPVLAGRLRTQGWLASVMGLLTILGYAGLFFTPSYPLMVTCIIFIGVGLGGSFPLGLALLGMRSRDARQAAELSGMAQAVGYILASVGPIFIGSLYDMTHSWNIPILTLMIVGSLVILFGFSAGRDKYV